MESCNAHGSNNIILAFTIFLIGRAPFGNFNQHAFSYRIFTSYTSPQTPSYTTNISSTWTKLRHYIVDNYNNYFSVKLKNGAEIIAAVCTLAQVHQSVSSFIKLETVG